jgi:hypothetical protein
MRPHYTVNDRVFFNKFQAFSYAHGARENVEFNLYNEKFDQVSWAEPQLTWDQLLDIRAQQIAAKNKSIILNFSGGTDSWTVYQVFKRNNIKIDVIYLHVSNDHFRQIMDPGPINFLKENADKIDSKILILEENESNLKEFYNDPNWLWEKNSRIVFSNGLCESQFFEYRGKNLGDARIDDDYIQVIGLDKPRLNFKNGNFYSYQDDTTYLPVMNNSRLEPFFVSNDLPELHIKQSYMLAKHILAKSKIEKKSIEFYNNIHDATKHEYYDYAYAGCGRFGEVSNSVYQKRFNRTTFLEIDPFNLNNINYRGRSVEFLKEGVLKNQSYALNYLNGLVNARNDPSLKNLFRDDKNYFSLVDLHSKEYKLDCPILV